MILTTTRIRVKISSELNWAPTKIETKKIGTKILKKSKLFLGCPIALNKPFVGLVSDFVITKKANI
jgi:hypothetical protein